MPNVPVQGGRSPLHSALLDHLHRRRWEVVIVTVGNQYLAGCQIITWSDWQVRPNPLMTRNDLACGITRRSHLGSDLVAMGRDCKPS
jgi:hypothetical protein